MRKKILFVDDEKEILRSLRTSFHNGDFDTFFAGDTDSALGVMENESIDMVVSDLRMPGKDGHEFLRAVKSRWPSVIRLVLSGCYQKETISKMLADGTAKSYFVKPWKAAELSREIVHFFEMQDSLRDQRLLDAVNSIEKLPTPPLFFARLIQMISDDASMDAISRMLEDDVALTSETLKIANSSFYMISVGTMRQALSYLGLIAIKDVVLAAEVFELLGTPSQWVEIIWRHSLLCNKFVHHFLHRFSKTVPEEAHTAGLLHDIGILLGMKLFPDKFKQLSDQVEPGETASLLAAEREIIGIGHDQLGAYLLDWWNFPSVLVESALYHHAPTHPNVLNKELVAIVHVADVASWKIIGSSEENDFIPEALGTLGVSREDLDIALDEFKRENEDSAYE